MIGRVVTCLMTVPCALLAVAVCAGAPDARAQQPSAIQRKIVLQQDLPIAGFQMVMTTVEIAAGGSEVRHTHPGGLGVYVQEGTIDLEHEGRPRTTYKAGDAFFVEAGKIHWAINSSAAPVKIVATLVVEKGKIADPQMRVARVAR